MFVGGSHFLWGIDGGMAVHLIRNVDMGGWGGLCLPEAGDGKAQPNLFVDTLVSKTIAR